MGDPAALQDIRLTAPEVASVRTSHRDVEKTYKNYVKPLGIKLTIHQFQSHNLDHCAICYWLYSVCGYNQCCQVYSFGCKHIAFW